MSASISQVIYVNAMRFEVDLPRLQGLQIRALANIPPAHALVIEGRGTSADRHLGDDEWVDLGPEPTHLYSKPPTMFGGDNSSGAPLS